MHLKWRKRGRSWETEHNGGWVMVERCPRHGWTVAFELCGNVFVGFPTAGEAKLEAAEYLRSDCPTEIQHWAAQIGLDEVPF